jgi:hypothetical protein
MNSWVDTTSAGSPESDGGDGQAGGASTAVSKENSQNIQYRLDKRHVWRFRDVAMPFNEQLAKLEKAKADLQQLESKISAERVAALAKLPSDFGYSSLDLFIKALKEAAKTGGKTKGKGSRAAKAGAGKAAKAAPAAKAAKAAKRAKITDEIKAQVKALSEAGKTGKEIARTLGISAPSVQNVKKALGLVKPRSASAPAFEAASAVEAAPVV